MSRYEENNSDFEQHALRIHNEYRKEHGVPPLILNKEICTISQNWADKLAKEDKLSYSLNEKYGENIYCGKPKNPSVKITSKDCIDKWYEEINDYSFGTEPKVLKCGHFSQIVWKSTTDLGIGKAQSQTGKVYIVANYFPPGNYSSKFVENLPPPGALAFNYAKDNSSSRGTSETRVCNYESVYGNLSEELNNIHISTSGFENECLERHNFYREKHGVPPLVLNLNLCCYAKEWAKELLKRGKMEHRKDSDYGENIFYAWSTDELFQISGDRPVDKWYDEIKDHVFGREPSNLKTGHFTQVMWEDSVELGVGIAKNKGHIYIVANYNPPGNVIGSYSKKVHPPLY